MNLIDRIGNLLDRITGYPPLELFVELGLIWIVVYAIIRFAQGTRAARALRGIFIVFVSVVLLVLLLRVLGGDQAFLRLSYLGERLFAIIAIGLVVVFQPELRRAMIRLGEQTLLRSTPGEIARLIDAIVDASEYLSRNSFGALMVIQRQTGLEGLLEGGSRLEARLSARLLKALFFPGAALHDLAVVISGSRIQAAGVQLPLAEPTDMPDPSLGSRHRAAVGLSRECDALVVVVSEETGLIRIAERGSLSPGMSPSELRAELMQRLDIEKPDETMVESAEQAGGDPGLDTDAEHNPPPASNPSSSGPGPSGSGTPQTGGS